MNWFLFALDPVIPEELQPEEPGIMIPISSILFVLVAIYFLVTCIRGKGKLFDTEKIREESIPAFKRTVRLILLPIAAFLIAIAVLDVFTDWESSDSPFYWVRLAVCILLLVGMISTTFLTRKFIDPEKGDKPLPTSEELKAKAEEARKNAEFPNTPNGVDDGSADRRFYD